jgi:hypothetical protein
VSEDKHLVLVKQASENKPLNLVKQMNENKPCYLFNRSVKINSSIWLNR